MTTRRIDSVLATDLPIFTDERPPSGVRQRKASAWCGGPNCPREVLVAMTADALELAVERYRCSSCGRPAF